MTEKIRTFIAIDIPDELLHPTGVFKERLSQSMLFAAMQRIPAGKVRTLDEVYSWDQVESQGLKISVEHATVTR